MSDNEEVDDEVENGGGWANQDDDSLGAALAAQWKSAPWYVSSLAIHMVIFLAMLLLPQPEPQPKPKRTVIATDVVTEEVKEEVEPVNEIIERNPDIVTDQTNPVDAPIIVTTDFEVSDHNETNDNMDMESARGDPDCVSTFDQVQGSPALMGVGHSGGSGGGGRFGNRNGGGRRNCVAQGGGSRKTESAVDWALQWLAAHQEPDGHWNCQTYGGKANTCSINYDVAVTSLATLAFLGAGNSTRFGKYKENVSKAVYWLTNEQDKATGLIGKGGHRYSGGISLMAMAEAYGMSQGAELKKAAQGCVDWAVKSQDDSGGWDYTPHQPERVDTSVTGWWVMGLKSAKVAGLDVKYDTFDKACKYMQHVTSDPAGNDGYGGYSTVSYAGDCKGGGADLKVVKRGGGSSRLTAVSLSCLQFLGRPRTDVQVVATANQVKKDGSMSDEWAKGKFNFYRWYYSALGMFQMGVKTDYWKFWNEPMKKVLLDTQVKLGTFKENKGSWDPDTDPYGAEWGRVGQTALGALMLEVYYRYYNTHDKHGEKPAGK